MHPSQALRERVALTVSQVILETKGKAVQPTPDEPLFENGYLDPIDLGHLVLRLQAEFDVTLDVGEANARALRSLAAISELIAARVRPED